MKYLLRFELTPICFSQFYCLNMYPQQYSFTSLVFEAHINGNVPSLASFTQHYFFEIHSGFASNCSSLLLYGITLHEHTWYSIFDGRLNCFQLGLL